MPACIVLSAERRASTDNQAPPSDRPGGADCAGPSRRGRQRPDRRRQAPPRRRPKRPGCASRASTGGSLASDCRLELEPSVGIRPGCTAGTGADRRPRQQPSARGQPPGRVLWRFPAAGDLAPGRRSCCPTTRSSPPTGARCRDPGGRLRDQRDRHLRAIHRLPLRPPGRAGLGTRLRAQPRRRDADAFRGADLSGHQELPGAGDSPAGSPAAAPTRGHRRLRTSAGSLLRQPKRSVPDGQRRYRDHRDQRRLAGRGRSRGRPLQATHPPGFTLSVGHQRGRSRRCSCRPTTPIPERSRHSRATASCAGATNRREQRR